MKFTYTVLLKKLNWQARVNAIQVPQLGIDTNLAEGSPEDQRIELIGINLFLVEMLLDELAERAANNESLTSLREEKSGSSKALALPKNPHDVEMKVEVDYKAPKQGRFFATYLPPMTKITVLTQMVAQTILDIGALQLTQNGLIPMGQSAQEGTAITEAILENLFMLGILYYGPAMEYLLNFSEFLDVSATKIKPYFTREEKESGPVKHPKTRMNYVATGIKSSVVLLVLNEFWSQACFAFQEISLLKDKIAASPNIQLPESILTPAAWIVLSLSLLNNPVIVFSFMMFIFHKLDAYMPAQPVTVLAGQTDEEQGLLGDQQEHEDPSKSDAPSSSPATSPSPSPF